MGGADWPEDIADTILFLAKKVFFHYTTLFHKKQAKKKQIFRRVRRYIFSVPCCQHELNYQMKNKELEAVLKYGLLKERIAALVTDGLRAEMLEQCGYDTQVLEFIDMEHTPKNILIRAVKRPMTLKKVKDTMLKEVHALMDAFKVNPTLYKLLKLDENNI